MWGGHVDKPKPVLKKLITIHTAICRNGHLKKFDSPCKLCKARGVAA
jgi:hypothetical protein